MFLVLGMVFLSILLIGNLSLARELDDVRHAIKEKGAKWIAADTSVSILAPAQRKKRASLILPVQSAYEEVLQTGEQAYALATSLDWRINGFVTGVRNQGGCGSCWAFAATAGLESSVLISSNSPNVDLNLSEQVMVSCSGAGSCGGGSVDQAANFVRDTGLPQESCYYYTATDGSCGYACSNWQASTYKIKSWSYVATSSPTVDGLKNGLASYGPLPTTMAVYNDFFYYSGGVYSYATGSLAGYHAILIVGYDDVGQYFIVKNSWGAGWGEGGFFKIAYSELNSAVNFGDWTIAYMNGSACSYSLNSTGQPFGSSGGTGQVQVTASAGCSWTAVSNAAWITITSGKSGTASGTVAYSVSANSTTPRTGTMTIAGQTYTVTQDGQKCTFSIAPISQAFGASGGPGSVSVTTSDGCSWTAVSNANWITVTSNSSATGTGTVNYSTSANTGTSSRTGTLTIASQTVTVTQEGGCSYSISPTGQSFSSFGGTGTVSVTVAGNGCPSWTATSGAGWITITSVGGPGNGTVGYTVAPNSNKSPRKGTLTIGGQIFTINQAKKGR